MKTKGLIIGCVSLILAIIVLGVFLITNGSYKKVLKQLPVGKASNLVKEEELIDIEKIFKNNNISNIDVFLSWVKEFNKEPFEGCGMVTEWTDIDKISYDEYACANRWEETHEQSDSDCRMTAFLLLENNISMDKTIEESGSYLMFDIDAIENNEDYKMLKEKENNFITLFNEIDVTDLKKEEIKEAFTNKWNEYGIKIKDGNASLISVVLHDNMSNVVFVGHTGVLIEEKGKLIFIEKIAFEQPYQISIFESREELSKMLFSRPTYFGDKTEEGPYIYENNKLLYSYK